MEAPNRYRIDTLFPEVSVRLCMEADEVREALDDLEPFHRLVILAIVDQAELGETPVRSFEVRRVCEDRIDECDSAFGGGVTRQEVVNALSELAAAELLHEDRNPESPTGKGRPAYEPAVGPRTILDACADDAYVGSLVERIEDRSEV